jgi:6-pyruvoyltetrahydropterin/6-carboxytetrahydropterin synthase
LESSTLDINNWVYDFGKFAFLEAWLREKFDHTLLVAENDPELDLIRSLDQKVGRIVELKKISCEYFAEITFKFLEAHFLNLDVKVNSVVVSEHNSNSAGYYRS